MVSKLPHSPPHHNNLVKLSFSSKLLLQTVINSYHYLEKTQSLYAITSFENHQPLILQPYTSTTHFTLICPSRMLVRFVGPCASCSAEAVLPTISSLVVLHFLSDVPSSLFQVNSCTLLRAVSIFVTLICFFKKYPACHKLSILSLPLIQ